MKSKAPKNLPFHLGFSGEKMGSRPTGKSSLVGKVDKTKSVKKGKKKDSM